MAYTLIFIITVNILDTNELVKLTMLWTTGPWILLFSRVTYQGRSQELYKDEACS